ncbi:MAG: dienelactone hydrolase family protein [Dehalococcoidia bacterium]|nr:dienelactone hydrolase family protein [Dehalococcoidia bacterium]
MTARWDALTVDGETMRCYVAAPAGEGPFPAVVVIQHAGGVDGFVQEMSGRFAAAGYVAIAPELYHRQDPESGEDPLTRMGRLRDVEVVRDVNAAIEHAGRLDEVAADRIGIAGFCMGGRVSYLMATHVASLRAAVVFYGGNIMVPWGEGPAPFERSESIACPLLGLFGEQDTNPSPADVAKIDAELTRRGKQHEFHTFAGVGHAFMTSARPGYRQDVAEDAWGECLGWLQQHLS